MFGNGNCDVVACSDPAIENWLLSQDSEKEEGLGPGDDQVVLMWEDCCDEVIARAGVMGGTFGSVRVN